MGNRWPFALFVVVDLDHKKIDEILGATLPGYAPLFWLASDKYDAPKKPYSNSDGTSLSIPKSFESPWIEKPINDLVDWLEAKPENIDLNDRHFAVLDQGARDETPSVVVCRIGDPSEEDPDLIMMRKSVVTGPDQLIGGSRSSWTEWARYGGKAEIRYDDNNHDDA